MGRQASRAITWHLVSCIECVCIWKCEYNPLALLNGLGLDLDIALGPGLGLDLDLGLDLGPAASVSVTEAVGGSEVETPDLGSACRWR